MSDDQKKSLLDVLAAMQEAMAPHFAAERARDEVFCPPLIEQLSRKGLVFFTPGEAGKFGPPTGHCPVQADGLIDDRHHFYFRARHEHWRLHISPTREEIYGKEEWTFEEEYAEGDQFAAGWMTKPEALLFIMVGLRAFRVWSVGRDDPFG